MAASSSSGDPDVDAAFGGPSTAAVPVNIQTGDPDVDAALPHLAEVSTERRKEKPPTLGAAGIGMGEGLLNAATGGVGALGGGLTYLGTLAASGGDTAAADAVRKETQEALTYKPRTGEGKKAASAISDIASYLGQKEGESAGNFVMDKTGSPVLASAVNTAANVPQFLLGEALGKANFKGEVPPSVTPAAAIEKAYGSQKAGADGGMPDISNVTLEVQEAIRQSGGDINKEALSRHLEASTLPVPVKLTKGQATQDPGLLSNEQNARGTSDELRSRFSEQNQDLVDNLDEIRRNAAPTAVGNDHIQNGQALLDKYKAYDAPIKQAISDKYKTLADANGGDLPVDGESFANAANSALKKSMKAPFLPAPVRSIVDSVSDGGPMTYENFENLRTTLAAEARKADRSGDGNAAAAVNLTRNALEQLPMSGATGKLKALADDARSAAAARFQEIGKDPAYKAALDDDTPAGESSPAADTFVKKYVLGGTKAGIESMKSKFADDPDASGTISAAALNYLKSKAGIDAYTNTGNFSQSGFNKARAELEPRMDQLLDSETADQVRKLGNVAKYTQAQPRGSFVNNSNTFVAGIANKAKTVAEHGANLIPIPGVKVGTALRDLSAKQAADRAIKESLAPGAGIKNE